jgi:hypothetical protein
VPQVAATGRVQAPLGAGPGTARRRCGVPSAAVTMYTTRTLLDRPSPVHSCDPGSSEPCVRACGGCRTGDAALPGRMRGDHARGEGEENMVGVGALTTVRGSPLVSGLHIFVGRSSCASR